MLLIKQQQSKSGRLCVSTQEVITEFSYFGDLEI